MTEVIMVEVTTEVIMTEVTEVIEVIMVVQGHHLIHEVAEEDLDLRSEEANVEASDLRGGEHNKNAKNKKKLCFVVASEWNEVSEFLLRKGTVQKYTKYTSFKIM